MSPAPKSREQFESILNELTEALTFSARSAGVAKGSSEFEREVRAGLGSLGYAVDPEPHPQAFPDIVLEPFGIEIKFATSDTWRSVGNSIFEGMRSPAVKYIYVVFGKMGGTPTVKWDRYEDCVMHVRTSHVPRFEIEIGTDRSLFAQFGIGYDQFADLTAHEKMTYVRAYARSRLREGERLWWLEDSPDNPHTLPLEVRLYPKLSQLEKRRLRAEAALLSPQIVKPPGQRDKYNDAALYLLTYRGVFCPQARDLFTAGSVALRADDTRGGKYILRSLLDIEEEMRSAAQYLDDALFVEYWGHGSSPSSRISDWLEKADRFARNWIPSDHLFLDENGV